MTGAGKIDSVHRSPFFALGVCRDETLWTCGASNLKLENNGSDVNVSIDVPGVGTQSRSSLGCFPYTRPYRP